MTPEFKDIFQGAIFKELEQFFLAEADKLQHKAIDRTKNYNDQGLESHVNELAAQGIRDAIKNIGQEINPLNTKKKIYK